MRQSGEFSPNLNTLPATVQTEISSLIKLNGAAIKSAAKIRCGHSKECEENNETGFAPKWGSQKFSQNNDCPTGLNDWQKSRCQEQILK